MEMPELHQIAGNVYTCKDRITSIYFVVGAERVMIIDTGFGSYDLKALAAEISPLPTIVVNTHGHPDHLGGNNQFDTVYVSGSEFDNEIVLGGRGKEIPWNLIPLKDGDVIDLGDCPMKIIEIPGHAPGHIAVLDVKNRILFSGDTLQEGPVFMFVPKSDISQLIASLQKLKSISSEFDEAYPAHNRTPVGPEYIDKLLNLAGDIVSGKALPQSSLIVHEMPTELYTGYGVSIYYREYK